MTRMHLMWFCAFSPHAGFGLDGWAGPRTTGYEWTRPELWQDMAVALERAKFDLIMLGDSLAVPGPTRDGGTPIYATPSTRPFTIRVPSSPS